MKKVFFVLSLLIISFLVSCNTKKPILTIDEKDKSITVMEGEEYVLYCTIKNHTDKYKVSYQFDEDIVLVSSNIHTVKNKEYLIETVIIKGLKAGNCEVVINYGENYKTSFNVIVTSKPTISLTDNEIDLFIGEEYTINPLTDKEYSYSIVGNDELITHELITINSSTNKLTALKEGTVSIKIYLTEYPEIYTILKVNILAKIPSITCSDSSVTMDENTEYSITFNTINSHMNDYDINISNPELITFNGSIITALKPGTCNIIVAHKTNKDVSITINITINEVIKNAVIKLLKDDYELIIGSKVEIEYTTENSQKEEYNTTSNNDNVTIEKVYDDNTFVGYFMIANKVGNATITMQNISNPNTRISFNVSVIRGDDLKIKITNIEKSLEIEHSLGILLTLTGISENEVAFTSSNTEVATVDNNGVIYGLREGKTIITAYYINDETIKGKATFNVTIDPIAIIKSLNIETPLVQYVSSYGYNPDIRYQWVYGSVNKYLFDNLNLIENIVPINKNSYTGLVADKSFLSAAEKENTVRSGILHEETIYITYHDTGNHTPGANALMHANYMVSTGNTRARSWHYTVDENCIYHHVPDNEVTWQGDSYDSYAKSIGIETCVNFGSDLYKTWQRTAKLMAKLMGNYGIDITNIKQHYEFSGKNCPQTLRMNNLYDYAISLVEAEYKVYSLLKGYTITCKSLNPEYVNDLGKVIKLPDVPTRVGYIVTITNPSKDYNESVVLYSNVCGADSEGFNEDPSILASATDFDLNILELLKMSKEEQKANIDAIITKYNELTENIKKYVTILPLLQEIKNSLL